MASPSTTMQLNRTGKFETRSDMELIDQHLPLAGTRLLELGCGRALTTRQLAETFPVAEIIATEVDQIQHQKNLQIDDLPKVTFKFGGAEEIDLPDASINAVIMLKSLHHVPVALMDQGLREIHRVLKPGGLAYLSEPIYAGAFNKILRLFNDEKHVREAAFASVKKAVASGDFELVDQIFFNAKSQFEGFAQFEELVLGVTHTAFAIDEKLHQEIKKAFLPHVGDDGVATFLNPHRVDLLRRI